MSWYAQQAPVSGPVSYSELQMAVGHEPGISSAQRRRGSRNCHAATKGCASIEDWISASEPLTVDEAKRLLLAASLHRNGCTAGGLRVASSVPASRSTAAAGCRTRLEIDYGQPSAAAT